MFRTSPTYPLFIFLSRFFCLPLVLEKAGEEGRQKNQRTGSTGLLNTNSELSRDVGTLGVGLPRCKAQVFCKDAPDPPKPHLSLSRQGHPKIAHRFNGGTSEVSDGPSPDRGDRNRRPRQSRIVAINPGAKMSVVPTGTRSIVQVLVPTVETVGYCRMSLQDKDQETTLREITLEALGVRAGMWAKARGWRLRANRRRGDRCRRWWPCGRRRGTHPSVADAAAGRARE